MHRQGGGRYGGIVYRERVGMSVVTNLSGYEAGDEMVEISRF